jgi:hypothetical protein
MRGFLLIFFWTIIFLFSATPAMAQNTAVEWAWGLYEDVYPIASALAVLMLIIGGYRYVTSRGNPDALGEAKAIIYSALAGLAVLILGKLILSTLSQSLIK